MAKNGVDPKTVDEAFAALDSSPDGKSKLASAPSASTVPAGSSQEGSMPPPKSSGSKANGKKANVTGEKRQLTLEGMFAKGGSKKARLEGQESSSPAGKAALSKTIVSSSTAGSSSGASPQRLSAIPFNTAKWASTLPAETRDLLALEVNPTNGIGHTYLKVLHPELTKTYFLDLKRFLAGEGVVGDGTTATGAPTKAKVYPPIQDIYTWSRRTPLDKVKVVIIGQDPYHGPNQAHGLCFSVRPGVAIPGSLRNIYTELKNEYPGSFEAPKHGSLLSWAASGVLLLNTSLTVRPGDAGSHAGKGWEKFTDAVVKAVDKYGGDGTGRGVVFLCWGAWAAKRVAGLSKTKHLILQSAHPSPLSAHRGFLGNGHFKAANVWLGEKYGEKGEIDWLTLLPDGPPKKTE